MRGVFLFAASLVAASGRPVLPVPEFKINLDLEPEERFKEVVLHFKPVIQDLFKTYGNIFVKTALRKIAKHRGPENDELAAEIRGMAKYADLPEEFVAASQLLYELQTIIVPVENVTWPWGQTTHRTGSEPLFGCTGIIARSADDGTVRHARNLDFSFAKWLGNMTYNGIFSKGGKEIYTAQMVAGYSLPLTGIRRGKNGYTIEINTRFPSKTTNVMNLKKHLFEEKRTLSGWIKRQVLQNIDNYEDAVKEFETKPYASTEYNIISGNQKGVILARDPDSVTHTLTLGPNKNDYIVVTNFDYWDHDIKEWFDPTSIHRGHSRRVGAQKILNASKNLNFGQLYETLNNVEVIAKDTIFQAFFNVEKNEYKSFLPDCEACSGCVSNSGCLKQGEDCCGVRSYRDLHCGVVEGRKCGCIPDGGCRVVHTNTTYGDMDCCSYQSHRSSSCPLGRKCGPKPSITVEFV